MNHPVRFQVSPGEILIVSTLTGKTCLSTVIPVLTFTVR